MVLYLREQETNVEERGRELCHFLEFPEVVFVFSKTNVIFIKGRQCHLLFCTPPLFRFGYSFDKY